MKTLSALLIALATATTVLADPPKVNPNAGNILNPSLLSLNGSSQMSPAAVALARARARTLGDNLSGSMTRYAYVTASDLKGAKTQQEILRRLQGPQIGANDKVRNVQVVYDLKGVQPLQVRAAQGQAVRIGTVEVSAARVRSLNVQSNISNVQVTVGKK